MAHEHHGVQHKAEQPQRKQGKHRVVAHQALNQRVHGHRAQHAQHQRLQLLVFGFLFAKFQWMPERAGQRHRAAAFHPQQKLHGGPGGNLHRKHHHIGADLTPAHWVAPAGHPGNARPIVTPLAHAKLHIFQARVVQGQPVVLRGGGGVVQLTAQPEYRGAETGVKPAGAEGTEVLALPGHHTVAPAQWVFPQLPAQFGRVGSISRPGQAKRQQPGPDS